MSTRIKLAALAMALAGALMAIPTPSRAVAVAFNAGLEINSPADFYSPLQPYGAWMTVPTYGRCWHPVDVQPDWRPYGTGYWEWTDCGWYWESDEPWSWACYHYGSWVFDPTYGWLWIPGTEWAPAWVVWRESPDYVGWAPCGPGGVSVAPTEFVFVDVHHFHERIRPGVFIANDRNIIERTRFVNNIERTTRTFDGTSRQVVVNRGPDPTVIQRASGTRFTARPIQDVVSRTPAPANVPRSRGAGFERPVQPQYGGKTRREQASPAPTQAPINQTRQAEPRPQTPTGRETPRVYQQPSAPRTPLPPTWQSPRPPVQQPPQVAPEPPRRLQPPPQVPQPVPPTGREVPRVYPQAPPEQVPPGRNDVRPEPGPQREAAPPVAPPQREPQRPAVPPGRERKDNGDRGQ